LTPGSVLGVKGQSRTGFGSKFEMVPTNDCRFGSLGCQTIPPTYWYPWTWPTPMWIPLPITGFLGARRMKNEERQASVVPKKNSSLVLVWQWHLNCCRRARPQGGNSMKQFHPYILMYICLNKLDCVWPGGPRKTFPEAI
jgi:hypothetical protein